MRSLGRAWLDQELPTFDAGHFIIMPQLGGRARLPNTHPSEDDRVARSRLCLASSMPGGLITRQPAMKDMLNHGLSAAKMRVTTSAQCTPALALSQPLKLPRVQPAACCRDGTFALEACSCAVQVGVGILRHLHNGSITSHQIQTCGATASPAIGISVSCKTAQPSNQSCLYLHDRRHLTPPASS